MNTEISGSSADSSLTLLGLVVNDFDHSGQMKCLGDGEKFLITVDDPPIHAHSHGLQDGNFAGEKFGHSTPQGSCIDLADSHFLQFPGQLQDFINQFVSQQGPEVLNLRGLGTAETPHADFLQHIDHSYSAQRDFLKLLSPILLYKKFF
ncbi:MAG: hypothetical protein JRG73_11940 [Deltaproteobacteria bacterium]|nr:hypothetical protein [Deltaproteobacteria bacterium]MBW2307632.1 hypothetical protein [Deltaproteobacteria bacterium]